MENKWRTILLLSLAELLSMSVWFSASAVIPALTQTWALNDSGRAWLTMSVQIGFVFGALGSAIFNLSDIIPSRRFFTVTAILAASCTALIAVLNSGLYPTLILRFLTGAFLAGVYPVGMKIITTWTKEDRGLGIGILTGALAIGSGAPHLLNAFGGAGDWKTVMYLSAAMGGLGGVITGLFVEEGPYKTASPKFNWKYVGEILRNRPLVLANLGYLGHMWELFAVWTWVYAFLAASFAIQNISPMWASVWAFATIAMGGVGSFIAGQLADKLGRTTITTVSMIMSGTCALIVGFFFGGNPAVLVFICLIWGFAVPADSAQFSASISEICKKEYTGTALTLQTSLGFLLTLITIRLIPTLESLVGWRWAFPFLTLGPIVGIWAMLTLRKLPEAKLLAGGKG